LKEAVICKSFKSVGSQLRSHIAVTENILSLIFYLTLVWLYCSHCSYKGDWEGMSKADKPVKYLETWPEHLVCKHQQECLAAGGALEVTVVRCDLFTLPHAQLSTNS